MRKFIIGFLFLGIAIDAFSSRIFINEFSSSNNNGIRSSTGKAYDWIEIYNPSTHSVSLKGYYLSDNNSTPFKWAFPNIQIPSKAFLLVFASGLDSVFSNGELHTNFSISKTGEDLLLVGPSGIVDRINAIAISSDISYGRQPDGTDTLKHFKTNTPGVSNTASGYSGYCPKAIFSQGAGFYTNTVNLSLSTTFANAEIRYTTDGSEPNITSTLYTSPISICDRSTQPNYLSNIPTSGDDIWLAPSDTIEKITVVKARVFKSGYLPGEVETNTYFVNANIHSRFKFPVISLSTEEDHLFNDTIGMYVPGLIYDSAKALDPHRNSWELAANYNQSGKAWEKPCHIEYFEPNGTLGFSIGMSVDIHGNGSRYFRHKSLNLKFNSDYNNQEYIDYPIFKNLYKNGNDESLTYFNSLILRSGGNGTSYLRDELIQSLVNVNTKLDIQAYTPAIVFINGEYWGIHNIREKNDLYYYANHYGVEEDSISVFKGFKYFDDGNSTSLAHIEQILSDVALHVTDNDFYDRLNTLIDISNYIDYYVTELYCNNTDWPGNNFKYWRVATSSYVPNANYGKDGRWRWMLYDTDFGFGLRNRPNVTFNSLAMATQRNGPVWPNPDESTWLFRKLLTNSTLSNQFINRYADLLNSNFKTQRVLSSIDSLSEIINDEIPTQVIRWHSPGSYQSWLDDIDTMRAFAVRRPSYTRQHIMSYFQLVDTVDISVDVTNIVYGKIRVNSLLVDNNLPGVQGSAYPWNGIYFKNLPIELEAIAEEGYQFVRWEGSVNSDSAKISYNNASDGNIIAVFEPKMTTSTTDLNLSNNRIKVFPNPNIGQFSVFMDNDYSGELKVSLVNSLGEAIWNSDYSKSSGVFQRMLKPANIPSGVYIVKIKIEEAEYFERLVIQN